MSAAPLKSQKRPPDPADKVAQRTVTAEAAGQLLQITPTHVRRLATQGWFERLGRGQYSLVGVVQGYIRYLKDEARRSSKSAGDNAVRSARAREIDVRTAIRERELVPTEEALAFVNVVIGHLVARLAGLTAQHTRDLDERRRLEQAVDAIRKEVADLLAKHGEAYRDRGGAVAPRRKNDRSRVGRRKPNLSADLGAAGTA